MCRFRCIVHRETTLSLGHRHWHWAILAGLFIKGIRRQHTLLDILPGKKQRKRASQKQYWTADCARRPKAAGFMRVSRGLLMREFVFRCLKKCSQVWKESRANILPKSYHNCFMQQRRK